MGMPHAFIELIAAVANLRPDHREHLQDCIVGRRKPASP